MAIFFAKISEQNSGRILSGSFLDQNLIFFVQIFIDNFFDEISEQNSGRILSGLFVEIFGPKSKAIALLFGKNWPFFLCKFFATKVSDFCLGQIWPKMQGYSLTLSPKNDNFFDEISEQISGLILSGSISDKTVRV